MGGRRQARSRSEFVDQGVSGAKDRRPALDRLVTDAKRRRFDVLVCWRLDRLGRNLRHLILLLDDLQAIEVDFVSLAEGIDPQERCAGTLSGDRRMSTIEFAAEHLIKPLVKKLVSIRQKREETIRALGNDFSDLLELAKFYIEPDCQHYNPADRDEDKEAISAITSPVFKTLNDFLPRSPLSNRLRLPGPPLGCPAVHDPSTSIVRGGYPVDCGDPYRLWLWPRAPAATSRQYTGSTSTAC